MASIRFIDALLGGGTASGDSAVQRSDAEALDAYSLTVTSVAELLIPSVASLKVSRRTRGGRSAEGAGSGVVITPDGFLITSAHVIAGAGRGRVIGINTAVAGIGLGLAVPINATTRRIVGALMRDGRFHRAYLGVAVGPRPLPPRLAAEIGRHSGVEVVEVFEGAPAARAGIRPEDLILDIDGSPIPPARDPPRVMVDEVIGRSVAVKIYRNGQMLTLTATPAKLQV